MYSSDKSLTSGRLINTYRDTRWPFILRNLCRLLIVLQNQHHYFNARSVTDTMPTCCWFIEMGSCVKDTMRHGSSPLILALATCGNLELIMSIVGESQDGWNISFQFCGPDYTPRGRVSYGRVDLRYVGALNDIASSNSYSSLWVVSMTPALSFFSCASLLARTHLSLGYSFRCFVPLLKLSVAFSFKHAGVYGVLTRRPSWQSLFQYKSVLYSILWICELHMLVWPL